MSDERRAESALRCIANGTWNVGTGRILSAREFAREALDRLRDARGDGEACPDCWDGRPKWAGTMPAPPCPTCGGTGKRSPQGEDHEAGGLTEEWLASVIALYGGARAFENEITETDRRGARRILARVSAPKADENQEAS